MKPLNLEETRLKEEMKERCLNKGRYIDENAKAKFDMLCHLEDFEIQYWELLKENKILKQNAENNDKVVDKVNWENMLLKKENKQLKEEKRKVRDYINKHCVNEKISKEVGYKCYTMADTNELEKIMKILGDK
ncbi:MAG: hypothetical protein ACI4WP_00860 [Bacilli bacterium]